MTVQEKSQAALAARDAGDQRWHMLVMMLSLALGITPPHVEHNIKELARTE